MRWLVAAQPGSIAVTPRHATTFQFENYGGASDLWGAAWTSDLVNATDFGVALTPMYLMTAGNARAYVDFITATVYYDTCN